MNNAQRLIERLRAKMPTHTNYAIAKALEMNPSQLARVIAGEYGLGPKAVIRLHELLQLDVRDLLVMIEEDKAKTPLDKEFWGRRSPRITTSIALAAMALGLVSEGLTARAATVWNHSCNTTRYTLCELRKLLDFLKKLGTQGNTDRSPALATVSCRPIDRARQRSWHLPRRARKTHGTTVHARVDRYLILGC